MVRYIELAALWSGMTFGITAGDIRSIFYLLQVVLHLLDHHELASTTAVKTEWLEFTRIEQVGSVGSHITKNPQNPPGAVVGPNPEIAL